ncbi:acyl-CoA dehydrogenase family protein [Frankia tisae]|uniref:acyl-CoA dehydrogenase family protein n=1 Tax=Frankia tisae TaxID=2950104 RepID=UPI0021C0424F|nr:acyl-CoA dehydrogenase family protein [Frankia tisae]
MSPGPAATAAALETPATEGAPTESAPTGNTPTESAPTESTPTESAPTGSAQLAGLDYLLAEIAAGAAEREAQDRPPFAEMDRLRRWGVGTLRMPVASGGRGLGLAAFFDVVRRLGTADPNLAQSLRNHFGFVESLMRQPPGGARDGWLDRVVAGELFGSAASELSTPRAGVIGTSTKLVRAGDGYLLAGSKYYSTGNMYADRIVVIAATEDGTLVNAIVPARREGVVHLDDWDGMGQRFTGSGTTEFHDVRVHETELLPFGDATDPGRALSPTFSQLYLTTIVAGIVENIRLDVLELVARRSRNFRHGLAEEPRHEPTVQETVGEIAANSFAATSIVAAAAVELAAAHAALGHGHGREDDARARAMFAAAKAKTVVDRIGTDTASLVFDAGSASSVRRGPQLDRHWRNIRTLSSHNPRSYKLRLIGDHELNGTLPPPGAFF